MNEEGQAADSEVPRSVKRARYLHPLVHYEGVFGRKERALKGWIAIGRDAAPPELPPFDEPRLMKDWWTRHMTQRVPDEIAALAISPPSGAALPPPVPAPVSPDAAAGPLFVAASGAASPVPPAPAPAPPPGAIVGYSGALQRLREAEAAAGHLYTSLLRQAAESTRTADERARLTAEAEQARRAWDDLVNRLRPMERDAAEILAAAGRVWNCDDVMASMDVIHLSLKESFLALWRRVRARLRACTDPGEEDKLWQAEVERLFAALRANKFTRPADVDEPAS